MQIPSLVYANKKGEIFDHPELKMSMRSAEYDFMPYEAELIPLPSCSRLYFMPHTNAVGFDLAKGGFTALDDAHAVSVFLPPAYLRLFLPSYKRISNDIMPLYAYTAVGWLNDSFVVPAIKVDNDSHWHPDLYDYSDKFKVKVEFYLNKYPKNRLYKQLAHCALTYHCTAAKNVFYPRWECPMPTSPACNSRCVGCISLQESECCPSPQVRMDFMPTAEEIAEVACNHAAYAEKPLISFGQGCEGDPVMAADVIAAAVRLIRKDFPKLTINFNSNCSLPDQVAKVLDAGVDSIRVSLNSTIEATYNAYYRPRGYSFANVEASIAAANERGVYVALNLLTMPGITDRKSECDALIDFMSRHKIELIQTRNLNIDAELLYSAIKLAKDELMGLKNMLRTVKKAHKDVKFGYFNRMKDDFFIERGLPDLKVKKFKK
ncbi:MAG: radical SAM protein [Deferribacteraceae bacterium]|jgi:molybdenum cofactor biosynthesis enzyme MoaA|nr:radical SAM protein [Deferribacteraceae bacterium]